jgi:coiled-coil domain-containing protein 55
MSFKFGLGGKAAAKPSTKKPLAFGDASDDEDNAADAPNAPLKKTKPKISQYGDLSAQKAFRKNQDKALEVDPSIYDYDAAYDAIQASNEAKKAAEREQAEKGEAKYIANILAARDLREKDLLRAKDSKMQRERETEGDEFADKEKFVTGAYKRQQEELRQQEKEEARREELERKKRENFGQRAFLNNMLEQREKRHHDDVEAAASAQPSKASEAKVQKTDSQIAREMNEKGANIALTDDGEIADRRQLLKGGLNVMAKPKVNPSPIDSKSKQRVDIARPSQPLGTKGSRERQTRMMEAQLEQMMKRQADDEADEERQKEHAAKSQKTSADVSSARERYLARKAAAAAPPTDS